MSLIERLRQAEQRKHQFVHNPQKAMPIQRGGSGNGISSGIIASSDVIIGEKTIIRTNEFCNLSRESKFHNWLRGIELEMHDDLVRCVAASRSCRENTDKMTQILDKLIINNESGKLVEFLKKEYPSVLKEI